MFNKPFGRAQFPGAPSTHPGSMAPVLWPLVHGFAIQDAIAMGKVALVQA